MQTELLSSDISNYLFTLREIRKLPISCQKTVYDLTDIYLQGQTPEEKDNALYEILDIFNL
jgi:hypothetical protein